MTRRHLLALFAIPLALLPTASVARHEEQPPPTLAEAGVRLARLEVAVNTHSWIFGVHNMRITELERKFINPGWREWRGGRIT